MNYGTIKKMLNTNAAAINLQAEVVDEFKESARWCRKNGEHAFAVEEMLNVVRNQKKLRKLEDFQRQLKAEIAAVIKLGRIEAKKVRFFGVDLLATMEARVVPLHTSDEIESAFDELLSIKFPKKVDSRPSDHPSLTLAGKA